MLDGNSPRFPWKPSTTMLISRHTGTTVGSASDRSTHPRFSRREPQATRPEDQTAALAPNLRPATAGPKGPGLLICAGWLPRTGVSAGVFRLPRNERGAVIALLIVASRVGSSRCHSATVADEETEGGYYSSRASDQHQPASSRAMAVLATVAFFLRSRYVTQRACRRRFPRSPRARAAGEAKSQRSRMVLPGW